MGGPQDRLRGLWWLILGCVVIIAGTLWVTGGERVWNYHNYQLRHANLLRLGITVHNFV